MTSGARHVWTRARFPPPPPTDPTWRRRDVVIVPSLHQSFRGARDGKPRRKADGRVHAGMRATSEEDDQVHRLLPRDWLSVLRGVQRGQRQQKWVQQTVLSLQAQPAETAVLRSSSRPEEAERPPLRTERCRALFYVISTLCVCAENVSTRANEASRRVKWMCVTF